jgi:hypothetical protein
MTTWSDDARVMVHPFRVYQELAASEEPDTGRRAIERALSRALFVLFVIGAFVSWTAAGRLVAFHVASTMVFWSFVPAIQAALFAAILRALGPGQGIARGLSLYFTGHGPWLLFLSALAGVCLFAPDVYGLLMWLLGHGILPALLVGTWAWSGLLTFACFHAGLGLSRRRAQLATSLFYAGYVGAIVSYYLLMNAIQPQIGSWVGRP